MSDEVSSELGSETRLAALYSTGLLDSPAEEAFDRLTRLVCRVLSVPVSLVSLVDADRQFFKSHHGLPEPAATERQTPLSHSFCQHVVRSAAPLVVSDAREDPRLRDNLAVRDLSVVAYLGIPLKLPDGHVIGSLCAIETMRRDWSQSDISTLSDIADVVMSEIALRREIARRMRSEEQIELVNRELGHRIKNIFAVTQSLLTMGARSHPQCASFTQAMCGRLSALSAAHGTFTHPKFRGDGAGADGTVAALVSRLLQPYPPEQWTAAGDDLPLGPASATALALIVHEAATNAVKYGALSIPGGHVAFTCTAQGELAAFVWEERGGPELGGPPAQKGFGTMLAERSAVRQLGGTFEQDWAKEGLTIRLTIPIDRLKV